jgi:hypothetical protein
MSSYMIRDLPPGLISRAKARAREEDTTLDVVLLRHLERYAEHGDPHAAAGRIGGAARAATLSPERRREIARKAATARWKPY